MFYDQIGMHEEHAVERQKNVASFPKRKFLLLFSVLSRTHSIFVLKCGRPEQQKIQNKIVYEEKDSSL
jgi:hypothetical protein